MSLQVWLPLNGNINNQGLADITVTSNGPVVDNNGKIGKCYSFDGTNDEITFPTMSFKYPLSMAVWFKTSNIARKGWGYVATINYHGSSNGAAANQLLSIAINDGVITFVADGRTYSVDETLTAKNDEWYHVAITIDESGNVKSYLNGVLAKSLTITPTITEGNWLAIGCRRNFNSSGLNGTVLYFLGEINDFRLYDHCLSAKEVAEIAKGLILHYKLDHNGTGGANMVNNSAPTELLESDELEKWNLYLSDNWIMDLVNCEGSPSGKCIQVTATADSISGGVFKRPPKSTDFVDGQKYTISAYIRSNVDGLKIKFCNEMMKSHGTPITLSTEWKCYSYTCDININNPYYANVFYVSDASQINTGTCIEVHSLKLEKGSRATPWIPSSADSIYTELGFNTTEEPDCSGFGNNGTMVGSFNYDTDSPRYMASTIFNGIDTYIVAGTGAKVKDEITVALWAYMDDWTEFTVNENHRFISCTEDGGWNFQSTTNDYIYFIIGTGSESNTYKSAHTNVKLANMTSGWHHFVGTFNGISVKMYMDGVLKNTGSAYSEKTPIFYNANNGIFVGAEAGPSNIEPIAHVDESFNGKMSDLRIYATALTDSQIKELYNSSGAIDSNGNLFCYEIEER